MWDTRHASDEDVEKTGTGERGEKKPTEHKESDKKITTSTSAQSQNQPSLKQDLFRFVNLGTELFAAVLVGTIIGWAIGRLIPRFATISIILGVIVGAAAGFLNMYNAIMELERKEEQRKRDSSK